MYVERILYGMLQEQLRNYLFINKFLFKFFLHTLIHKDWTYYRSLFLFGSNLLAGYEWRLVGHAYICILPRDMTCIVSMAPRPGPCGDV
jgi:hypothetical protein